MTDSYERASEEAATLAHRLWAMTDGHDHAVITMALARVVGWHFAGYREEFENEVVPVWVAQMLDHKERARTETLKNGLERILEGDA